MLGIISPKHKKVKGTNTSQKTPILSPSRNKQSIKIGVIVFSLVGIILFASVIRIRLASVPLERDEGEYAYAGQLILKGIPPYQQFYNMKLPGIYVVYAGIMTLFGQTHTGIHLGLLVVNVTTIIMIFFLARKVMGVVAGIMAAACFAILAVGQAVQGVFANAEHFVILPVVAGFLLVLKAFDNDRPWLLFLGAFCLGIGFVIKQHGLVFVAFGGLYVLLYQMGKRPMQWMRLLCRCGLFLFGAFLPYLLTCLILALAGVFDKFWFWTVDYAMAYSAQVPLEVAWGIFKERMVYVAGSNPILWILAGVGLIAVFSVKQARKRSFFVAMFFLSSFFAICPGFYFRPHYFILVLPVVSLLGGIAISVLVNHLSDMRASVLRYGLPIGIAGVCLILSVYQQRLFLFKLTPIQVCHATYGYNPFPESLEISRFIRNNSNINDRIAVIGSEPQVYFYSKRLSATGYIYMYALMERHNFALQMQKEMIREIESSRPKFLLFVNINTSWLKRPDSQELVFKWFQHYQATNYVLTGIVEIYNDKTLYHWKADAKWPPKSPYWIGIFSRKNNMSAPVSAGDA